MKVILNADIKGVGKKGQVLDVSDGYAKNFILPKKLGVEASTNNLTAKKRIDANEEEERKRVYEEALALKEKIEDLEVVMYGKLGNGKLFGSITNKEIHQELLKQHNIDVEKKKISLRMPINNIGTFTCDVKLHNKVNATLTVKVNAQD